VSMLVTVTLALAIGEPEELVIFPWSTLVEPLCAEA
jgi:hypothetical protein